MIRKFFRTGIVCLGFFGLTIPTSVVANVEAVGTPLVAPTIRQYQVAFTKATGIRAAYTNALDDIATSELFAGIYDLAVVEFPSAGYRLQQSGLFQFPLFSFGVAVVANVPGVPVASLRLNGDVLAAIYMGRITRWNDPKISALNPGLNLPPLAIVPVAQSDGSVATLNFTRYLADGSADWHRNIGIGSGLIWPLGDGEKDSRTAAQKVLETEGALGFQPTMNLADFNMTPVQLQNAQGHYVTLSNTAVRQAFERQAWAPVTGQPKPEAMTTSASADASWPIISVVYGQMKLVPEDIPDAVETIQFLTWALKNSQRLNTQPGLWPVAFEVVAPALNSMVTQKTYDGRASKKGGGS